MKINVSRFILTGVLAVAVFASSTFLILPSSIPNQLSAFAAFPGENGKIAFSSLRDGNYEIYVMNADGSEPTMLVDTQTNERHPSWSPDGTQIAYENQGRIFVMNADGTGQRQISRNPFGDDNPDWSPDGTKIAFSRGQEIGVMNADG